MFLLLEFNNQLEAFLVDDFHQIIFLLHCQLFHGNSLGHSGVTSRGVNVIGNPGYSSSTNGIGGSIPGILPTSAAIGNRNAVPGLGVGQILGNAGHPICKYFFVQTSGPHGIGIRPLNSTNTVSGMGSYDQLMQQYQQHQNQSQFRLQQMSPVNQSFRDHGIKSMLSTQSAPDSFGLLGFLSVIRMSDPDLTSLALGIDLTTLGLNLNATENLNKTFGSPWSDEPVKGDPEFTVPQCYYAKLPPAVHQGYFSKFSVETLFYIFYSMPRDEAQLHAANELYNKGWFYHKDLKWITRVPNMEPLVKTNTYERGSYHYFDTNTFEIARKDNSVVQHEMLEKRPILPQH